MQTYESQNLKIELETSFDPSSLRDEWLDLELRCSPNFFLSWSWIGTWLETYPLQGYLLRVLNGRQTVGLGVLTESQAKRFYKRYLNLHKLGCESKDQIWIEYNDFLIDKAYEKQAKEAIGHFFSSCKLPFDRLLMGASRTEDLEKYSFSGLLQYEAWCAPSYGVNLEGIRAKGQVYLDVLSRNTRSLIRRTQRKFEAHGEITFSFPKDLDEALDIFDRIAPIHIQRWGGESGTSGFLNPDFVEFHQNLIKNNWSTGNVELVRMNVGEQSVAYLYNFIYRGTVYFYIGAFDWADQKLKPGLLCHALCIQRHLENGMDYYDFMAGDMQYKRSLGKVSSNLVVIEFQKPNLYFRALKLARRLKHIFERSYESKS